MRKVDFLSRIVCIMCASVFATQTFCSPSVAANVNTKTQTAVTVSEGDAGSMDYSEYVGGNANIPYAKKGITLLGGNYASENGSGAIKLNSYSGKKNVLIWESGAGSVTFTADIPEDALYNICLSYKQQNENITKIHLGIMIDNRYLFTGMKNIIFPLMWKNEIDKFSSDSNGNQLIPEQVLQDGFTQKTACDATGVTAEPYGIRLTAGRHSITLVALGEPFVLENVELMPPEGAKEYSKLSMGYNLSTSGKISETINIQGENAVLKSTHSLIPESDSTEAGLTPSSPYLTKLNYIGGTSWELPGETLVWNFKVGKSVYFKPSV